MVRLLVVVAPAAAACFSGLLLVGGLPNTAEDDLVSNDGMGEEELNSQLKELGSAAKNIVSPTDTVSAAETSASSVPPENNKSSKKLVFATPVLFTVILAALSFFVIARKRKPPEDKHQQYAMAVEKLQEAQAEAERLRRVIPALYDELIEAYEEHFEAIRKRLEQAYSSILASNLVPCSVVGKFKGRYLKMVKSSQPAKLAEAWAQLQRHLDADLAEPPDAGRLSSYEGYAAEVEAKLELLKRECASLLSDPRKEVLKQLETFERDPESAVNAFDEPMSELDIMYGQQFMHQLNMVHNRSSTFRTVKKALDPLASNLTRYALKMREASVYTLKIEELKQAMDQSRETAN